MFVSCGGRCVGSPVNPSTVTLKNIFLLTWNSTPVWNWLEVVPKRWETEYCCIPQATTNRWPEQNSIWTPTKSHHWFNNHFSFSHYLYGPINYWHTIFHLWGGSCVNRRPHCWDFLHCWEGKRPPTLPLPVFMMGIIMLIISCFMTHLFQLNRW